MSTSRTLSFDVKELLLLPLSPLDYLSQKAAQSPQSPQPTLPLLLPDSARERIPAAVEEGAHAWKAGKDIVILILNCFTERRK